MNGLRVINELVCVVSPCNALESFAERPPEICLSASRVLYGTVIILIEFHTFGFTLFQSMLTSDEVALVLCDVDPSGLPLHLGL